MTNIIPNADTSGLTWTKSTYSSDGGNCVEVAHGIVGAMPVRDSKVPAGPALVIRDSVWGAFVAGVKRGDV
ncbi:MULTISPECIES: DUF397 domain-containing protein [unclassified Streptomyces]|uniref:DUF397 domain-containing protein n=1 Tax=unclassified Streptomyces TaxID=2593676 RepID=UPI0033EE8A4B